jgi:hypothetical protein
MLQSIGYLFGPIPTDLVFELALLMIFLIFSLQCQQSVQKSAS